MISSVLTLFKTFGQMILLRKGPQDIPHSSFLLVAVAFFWLVVGLLAVVFIETYMSSSLLIDLVLAIIGLGIYAVVVRIFGYGERLTRCFTALLGCSVVFSVALFSARLFLPTVMTENEAGWAVQLIWLWSIPVEGHIIARTIDRLWSIGFLIALTVLVGQLQLYAVIKPMLESAT